MSADLSRCSVPGCDLIAVWCEVIVWRHARDYTAGKQRDRESARKLENPGRMCEAHAKLKRLGLHHDQMALPL